MFASIQLYTTAKGVFFYWKLSKLSFCCHYIFIYTFVRTCKQTILNFSLLLKQNAWDCVSDGIKEGLFSKNSPWWSLIDRSSVGNNLLPLCKQQIVYTGKLSQNARQSIVGLLIIFFFSFCLCYNIITFSIRPFFLLIEGLKKCFFLSFQNPFILIHFWLFLNL